MIVTKLVLFMRVKLQQKYETKKNKMCGIKDEKLFLYQKQTILFL